MRTLVLASGARSVGRHPSSIGLVLTHDRRAGRARGRRLVGDQAQPAFFVAGLGLPLAVFSRMATSVPSAHRRRRRRSGNAPKRSIVSWHAAGASAPATSVSADRRHRDRRRGVSRPACRRRSPAATPGRRGVPDFAALSLEPRHRCRRGGDHGHCRARARCGLVGQRPEGLCVLRLYCERQRPGDDLRAGGR